MYSNNDDICGPDCQFNKTVDELHQKYLNAQMNERQAPSQVEKAQKQYIVFKDGEQKYNEQQKKKLVESANHIGGALTEKMTKLIESAVIANNEYDAMMRNEDNAADLIDVYDNKNAKLTKKIRDAHDQTLTNDRKTYYKEQKSDYLTNIENVLRYVYVILVIIFAASVLVKFSSIWRALGAIILIIFVLPRILKWLWYWIFRIKDLL